MPDSKSSLRRCCETYRVPVAVVAVGLGLLLLVVRMENGWVGGLRLPGRGLSGGVIRLRFRGVRRGASMPFLCRMGAWGC